MRYGGNIRVLPVLRPDETQLVFEYVGTAIYAVFSIKSIALQSFSKGAARIKSLLLEMPGIKVTKIFRISGKLLPPHNKKTGEILFLKEKSINGSGGAMLASQY